MTEEGADDGSVWATRRLHAGPSLCCDACDTPPPSRYECPHCGAVSYNPNDARERYCVRCHEFETP